tara:strand:- start:93 stop:365 length:273 start_codon:yes stop_codon:yes gene_type:complete
MVTIKDAALGKYSISETNEGLQVLNEEGTSIATVASLELALQTIANYLFLEGDATCSLHEYGQKKRQIFESIIAAQEGRVEMPLMTREAN